jgi:hypothetical protein
MKNWFLKILTSSFAILLLTANSASAHTFEIKFGHKSEANIQKNLEKKQEVKKSEKKNKYTFEIKAKKKVAKPKTKLERKVFNPKQNEKIKPDTNKKLKAKDNKKNTTTDIDPKKFERELEVPFEVPLIEVREPSENDRPVINWQRENNQNGKTYNIAFCHMLWHENMPEVNRNLLENLIEESSDYYRTVSKGAVNNLQISHYLNSGESLYNIESDISHLIVSAAKEGCINNEARPDVDFWIFYPMANQAGEGSEMIEYTDANEVIAEPRITIGNFNRETNEIQFDYIRNSDLIVHEIGHAVFGLDHGNFLDCGKNSFGIRMAEAEYLERLGRPLGHNEVNNLVSNIWGCEIADYDHYADVMGTSRFLGTLSSWFQVIAGNWAHYQHVEESGEYQLTAVAENTDETQLLRIPVRGSSICLEYRKPIGYDESLSRENIMHFYRNYLRGEEAEIGLPEEGQLFISVCPGSGPQKRQNVLIDTKPRTEVDYQEIYDVGLDENTLFRDNDLGLSVSWQAEDNHQASVNLEIWDPEIVDHSKDIKTVTYWVNQQAVCNGDDDTAIFSVEILNNSETAITEPFTNQVVINTINGPQLLDEIEVESMNMLGSIKKFYNTNQYRGESLSFEVLTDAYQEVEEFDEENNNHLQRFCRRV